MALISVLQGFEVSFQGSRVRGFDGVFEGWKGFAGPV